MRCGPRPHCGVGATPRLPTHARCDVRRRPSHFSLSLAPASARQIEPSMPLEGSLVASFAHRAVLDVLLGFTGAAAFSHMSDTTLNVLQAVAVHPQCGTGTRAAGVTFVISSLASNIVDYAMVAARNLECHVGSNAALIIGVGFPFASGWLFYFGQSFSDLITLASPLLNGVIQFVVPGVLFYLYSR